MPSYTTLLDWAVRESIRFSSDADASLPAAVDKLLAALNPALQLLALGEPLHGSEELLLLRNKIFQHLVYTHNFTAIAIESSFPRAHIVNEYIDGRGPASYDALQETGFSHNFGRSPANRELVEWMRQHNASRADKQKIRFYGFDAPTEMTHTDSPRQLLHFALEYLAAIDPTITTVRRQRIDTLLGDDTGWQNPAANFDHTQSIGLSPDAAALRIETENLLADLLIRRPNCIAKTNIDSYDEATHHAAAARQLLAYHAGVAQKSPTRIADLLAFRDAMMADNLLYLLRREQSRTHGKLFVHAHNSHLQRGQAHWQLGPHDLNWYPAGAHVAALLGPAFANIATSIATSASQGLPAPEPNTLESLLPSSSFTPTQNAPTTPNLPIRSPSTTNPTYFPLSTQSLAQFDAILLYNPA